MELYNLLKIAKSAFHYFLKKCGHKVVPLDEHIEEECIIDMNFPTSVEHCKNKTNEGFNLRFSKTLPSEKYERYLYLEGNKKYKFALENGQILWITKIPDLSKKL